LICLAFKNDKQQKRYDILRNNLIDQYITWPLSWPYCASFGLAPIDRAET